jgi:hypothetical protein
LEEAAGAPPPKGGAMPDTKYYFWQKFGTDKRLQHIFEKHFNRRIWNGKEIGSRNDKLDIASKLFSECWAKSSETVYYLFFLETQIFFRYIFDQIRHLKLAVE